MEAMDGDFDRAESLMETADVEKDNRELRAVRNKICEKYAEAAKDRLVKLDVEEESYEKASQQMTLARCYFVWGMYDDAEQLLTESIEYFETQLPGCHESLVAHLTLLKIFQRSGQTRKMDRLLRETLHRFRDQKELLASDRGKSAWSVVNALARNAR